ncbi:molybdate ABC transporter substrate-binding protein [Haematomicrobium sanguinis]|uniref:molybdate ABC transporter substrate-binding protein n=1 Tax=Haematomicrobium sanguinis TaxID=479106 RepID=UPI000A032875|nr:molybdate ABC transporter substrate-binding protein [Haematomicrobium sanguinis]
MPLLSHGFPRAATRILRAGTAIIAIGVLSACSSPTPASTQAAPKEITIYAAASLTESFNEIAEAFNTQNPQYAIAPISYDGSATLATQINSGAPLDVFASADMANMDKVIDAGKNDGDARVFARNILSIVVAKDNPQGIASLADLTKPGVKTVLCAPEVPCGAASTKLLDANRVEVNPVSEEQNVKAVLTKVSTGEADAGLVYVTDVNAAGDAVSGVSVPNADQFANDYYIAKIVDSNNPKGAQAFIDYLLSAQGQDVLARYGFKAP